MLAWLQGKKTYIAAAGLLVTAVLQFTDGNISGAIQSIMGALAAFGLRQALAAQDERDGPTPPVSF